MHVAIYARVSTDGVYLFRRRPWVSDRRRERPAQSHHRDALDLDQNSRMGEVGHRD